MQLQKTTPATLFNKLLACFAAFTFALPCLQLQSQDTSPHFNQPEIQLPQTSPAQTCEDGDCLVPSATASCSSAYSYASEMNRRGFFRHDSTFRGAEVIYRSSGTATKDEAMRWWMNSPAHRRLVVAGLIQDVQCVGSVCVGRSLQAGQSVTSTARNVTTATTTKLKAKARAIRSRFNRCR